MLVRLGECSQVVQWDIGSCWGVDFWNDAWCGAEPLAVQFPDVFALAQRQSGPVRAFWAAEGVGGQWLIQLRRSRPPPVAVSQLSRMKERLEAWGRGGGGALHCGGRHAAVCRVSCALWREVDGATLLASFSSLAKMWEVGKGLYARAGEQTYVENMWEFLVRLLRDWACLLVGVRGVRINGSMMEVLT
ncbi:hypothetical protein QJS10_CPA03g02093 [Acorus calamus]|uniref:Uncharacterized protein n=1 Tax=Acorus calamus TaxID=4465 RepID=A0AAV9F7B5_ACOCL|nr:hypothetical protein QJS10_CPA03g02093 [Acorus calamus]